MDNFPLQALLFGIADQIIGPFCYGCAGFVLSYRVARSITAKLFSIFIVILCFLWMDNIWPAIAIRSSKIAVASENRTITKMFKGNQQVGRAEFNSGEKSSLWDVFELKAWNVGSAVIFVSLAFVTGNFLIKRATKEPTPFKKLPPPPPGTIGVKPPPPPPQ